MNYFLTSTRLNGRGFLSDPCLQLLVGVDLHAGAHGGGGDAAADILALGGGGLGLDDGADEGVVVLDQLVRAEADLADGAVDDVGLVEPVLDLAGLGLLDGLGDVRGDGAGLGGGHEALGAEQLAEAADDAHHVGRGDDRVELEPVLGLDLLDEVLTAGVIGAGRLGLLLALGLAEDQDAQGLAGAVGQHDGAADLLVGVTGVNAQLHVQLDRLVELRLGGLADEVEGVLRVVQSLLIYELCALFIILTSEQFAFLLKCGSSEMLSRGGSLLPRLGQLSRRRLRPCCGRCRRSWTWRPRRWCS